MNIDYHTIIIIEPGKRSGKLCIRVFVLPLINL
ncbi:MAG: hypothetical protein RLZZ419_1903 [Pseudomonadota bacterium]|jgi:uncharacterized protein (DUF433 family)